MTLYEKLSRIRNRKCPFCEGEFCDDVGLGRGDAVPEWDWQECVECGAIVDCESPKIVRDPLNEEK